MQLVFKNRVLPRRTKRVRKNKKYVFVKRGQTLFFLVKITGTQKRMFPFYNSGFLSKAFQYKQYNIYCGNSFFPVLKFYKNIIHGIFKFFEKYWWRRCRNLKSAYRSPIKSQIILKHLSKIFFLLYI